MSEADPLAHALSGGIGGVLSMAVTYPLVTLSTLAQTRSSKTTTSSDTVSEEQSEETINKEKQKVSVLKAAKYLYQNEGIRGFYSGLESAIFGMFLNNLVYYYFYELTSKPFLSLKRKNRNGASKGLNPLESIITGAVAGSITVFATNPIWVANTRMTVSGNNKSSTLSTLINIVKKDGFKTLFSGVLPALILVLNPIIQYTIFEQLKNFLNKTKKSGMSSIDAFFIGALGKLAATGSTYPYITVKSRMHLKQKDGKYKSIAEWFVDILKNEGISGLYNGITVKLSQSVLTAAFLFFFKEELVLASIKLLKLIKHSKTASLTRKR